MSFFLVVPEEGRRGEQAGELARIVGAHPLSPNRAVEVLEEFFGEAGGPPFSFGHWRFLEVPDSDPGRLSEISRLVRERLERDGIALVELDERLISISELQETAAGLGLEVELVAIVKERGNSPPPLTPEYQALLDAITFLGGRNVATAQIARHVGEPPWKVRRWLRLLVQWRRIVRTGRLGGARYSLVDPEPKDPGEESK